MASLQSLDQHGSVVYVGTASKIFFPALKVGWMVVPDHLVELIGDVKSMADASPSTLEQLALAEFIKQGHLERHIYRMRKGHGRRRATLLATIAECLGNRVSVQGSDAGIHVLLRLHTLRAGQMDKLLELCRAQDVGVYSSAGYYQTRPLAAELILGYGALSHAEIRLGIGRLAAVIAQLEAEAGVESAGGVNG
jgi:GntR family transcriptional regulator/MocR family aminotransferase